MMIGVRSLSRPSMTVLRSNIIHPSSLRYISISRRIFQNQSPIHESSIIQQERDALDKLTKAREERQRYRNRTAGYYSASLGIVFLALAFCAVPIYRAICQRTGWGGIPITDSAKFTPDKVIPVETNKRIRIQFTCQSSGVLPWKFTPLQREVYVVPGETALAFYRAKNMSKEDIIGMATYSVTPENVAAYFNKIQCFCFEEQRLSAGEEVDMPVFFFIDPDFAKDPSMRNIDDVVLNYSFFKATYSDGELAAVPVANIEFKATIV
ncbi:Cox11 cytochrome oxidase assembly protein [Scheffersomyces coipomensis]|uniref:Cox11 cytochrome oxidase assembly protein n=1 Tax=Scheffersomyces coipomensis TaxID=1788519 RepID=UPI00315CD7D8